MRGARTGNGPGISLLLAVAAIVAAVVLPSPGNAQEPVDCDRVTLELVDLFANPICYKIRFRGGGMGRYELIHGETPNYMVNFRSSRAGAGSTYLHALDFDILMDHYGLTGALEILGQEADAGDGFDYVSVGGPGLDSCILFLKQVRPISNGYRANFFGLACDKRRQDAYSPQDAAALLDLIKNY